MQARTFVPAMVGFIVGAVAAWGVFLQNPGQAVEPLEKELHLGQKEFINPLVDCAQMPDEPLKKNKLHKEIKSLVNKLQSNANVSKISVGFRDLIGGANLRIAVDDPFMAASLLKVPIAISILRNSLEDPSLLNRMLTFTSKEYNHGWKTENAAPSLTDGAQYSIEDLIRRMITDSDNMATQMLLRHLSPQEIIQDLNDMGVILTQKDGEWWISVGEYASIFRILYNATFLPPAMSNKLLRLLTQTSIHSGMVDPIESGIPVAHKFGERGTESFHQFHDCGIVYYPKRPYLLCVMTQGSDLPSLKKVVGEISAAVFNQIKTESH